MMVKTPEGVRQATADEALELDELGAWRESCVVTAFQAKAALMASGRLEDVEAIVAESDEVTRLAWSQAREWPRTSPTIAALSQQMGMDDAAIDALFRAAEEIQA